MFAVLVRSRKLAMFGIFSIYYFLKFLLFFSIVKALVKFESLGNHFLFLGILYSSLVGFLSYVFIISTSTNQNDFHAAWVMKIHELTGLSPWLSWLSATLVLSTIYFKLISKFEDGIVFWILLFLGIPLVIL